MDMDEFLKECFPESKSKPPPEEIKRVPLVSELLQDLETKGYKCKACERSNIDSHLRFFIINETTEIFKCESRHCMFPSRNFIFRDRKDHSFFTFKEIAAQVPPSCSTSESTRDYAIEEHRNDLPSTSKVEEILFQLFPDDDEGEEEVIASPTVSPEHPPPLPEREKSKSPPKVLSKTFDFIAKKKLFAPHFNIQPKNIKSPLDLVKSLLKCKEEPVEEEDIQNSLANAQNQLKSIIPVLKSPRKKQQPMNRPPVIRMTPSRPIELHTSPSPLELPSLDVEEVVPEVKRESSIRIKAEPADKTTKSKAKSNPTPKKPSHNDVDEKPSSPKKVKTNSKGSEAPTKARRKVIKTEAKSSAKETKTDSNPSTKVAQAEEDKEQTILPKNPATPSTSHSKRERKPTKFFSPESTKSRKSKTETLKKESS